MKNNHLFALWGGMFVLCAGLGFIPEPAGALKTLLTVLSVAFFVPGFLLLRQGGRRTAALVRNLSLASLTLTVALIICNFLAVTASEALGHILYYMLVIVSSPMVCSGYWALSLFLWACLMLAAMGKLKKKK